MNSTNILKKTINEEYKHNLMIENISFWEKKVDQIMDLIKEEKISIMDVGAAEGSSLLAFNNKKKLSKGFLVDKNWNLYLREFLLAYEKDNNYYNQNNIKTFNCDGLDRRLPFDEAQMVIMTFNEGIDWADLYPKVNKAKYFLADDYWGSFLLNHPELEIIFNFNLYPIEKNESWAKMRLEKNMNTNPYYLFKKKD